MWVSKMWTSADNDLSSYFGDRTLLSDDCRFSKKSVLIIVLYGASLLFFGLGTTRVLTHHEALFSTPAKEMLATGDWVVPRIAGVPSTHKPPGMHWVVASMMAVTGSCDELVVRIPAVVSGIVTALLIGLLAARWFGERVGLVAGLMSLTTHYCLRLSRVAEAEMPLTAAVCAAMFCFALARIDSPSGRVQARWPLCLFWMAVCVAFFLKGMIGPVFVAIGCFSFVIWRRDWQGAKFLLNPIGILFFVGCVAAWAMAAWWRYPQFMADQVTHHFGRFQGELGGEQGPFFYLYSILLVVLPWTPIAIWAVVVGIRQEKFREPLWQFFLCWIVPSLLLLCASTFKRDHYLTPLVPPLVVLAAVGLIDLISRREQKTPLFYLVFSVVCTLLCAVGIAIVIATQPKGAVPIAVLIGIIGVAGLITTCCEYTRRYNAQLIIFFAATWIVAIVALNVIMPRHDSYLEQTELAQRINRVVPDGEELYLVNLFENQIAYYLEPKLTRVDAMNDFWGQLPALSDGVCILGPKSLGKKLAERGTVEVVDQCVSVKKYQTENGRLMLYKFSKSPIESAKTQKKIGQIR